jgi:hypothetical protein
VYVDRVKLNTGVFHNGQFQSGYITRCDGFCKPDASAITKSSREYFISGQTLASLKPVISEEEYMIAEGISSRLLVVEEVIEGNTVTRFFKGIWNKLFNDENKKEE